MRLRRIGQLTRREAFLAAAVSALPTLGAQTVHELAAQGDAALKNGQYRKAISFYDQARGLVDPRYERLIAGLLFKKAQALIEAGDTYLAILAIEMAQDLHQDDQFDRIRAHLEREVLASIVSAEQIVQGLKTKGFVPTGSTGLNVWVGFRFDSAELTESGEWQLAQLAEAMRNAEFYQDRFLLIGHTDSRGTAEYNLELSERRARRLRDLLVSEHGFSGDRIEFKGRGESDLRVLGDSEDAHARNRRVEVLRLRSGQ